MVSFIEIIEAIECEIRQGYLPGAIQWCDANCDNAWSNAIDEFDIALSVASNKGDFGFASRAAVIYKKTLIDLLKRYKESQKIDEVDEFLGALRKRD